MRITLTGATGFLGRAVINACEQSGYEINAISRSASVPAFHHVKWFKNEEADIEKALIGSDVVVHLATSYGRPGESVAGVISSNIELPVLLAEKAAIKEIPILIGDSFFAKKENSYNYLKFYTETKRSCLKLVQSVANERVPIVQMVFEHIYGPGDNMLKTIPKLVKEIVCNVEQIKLTDGTQTRDFIHVDDAALAVLTLASQCKNFQRNKLHCVEIGAGNSISLKSFLELAHQLSGSRSTLCWGCIPQRIGEPNSRGADTRVLRKFGWVPRKSLNEGLLDMIKQFKKKHKIEAEY